MARIEGHHEAPPRVNRGGRRRHAGSCRIMPDPEAAARAVPPVRFRANSLHTRRAQAVSSGVLPRRVTLAIGWLMAAACAAEAPVVVVAESPAVVVPPPAPAAAEANPAATTVPEVGAALPAGAIAARWLAAGGGSTPEFNQVSIEQDLGLARTVLGAGGLLLFAGGRGAHGVQVESTAAVADPLVAQLADLFAPRGGRTSSYRATTLEVDAAATVDNVQTAMAAATATADAAPLMIYLAGHGVPGATPGDTAIDLWGQASLRAVDLATTLDAGARAVRVVVTSCFSGGFAELAFVGADAQGPPARGRCGLFAATAEREASGCDPNPDRAAQEGYGLHFLNALRGRDRDGQPLARAAIDLDGDGRVSLLEAHTRVRVASRGIDVPTTTSDRWLRAKVPGLRGRSTAAALPEEEAVIAALAGELGDELAARAALVRAQTDMSEVTGRIDQAGAAEDTAYRRAAAEVLARWPVLDDPWHPDFAATLAAGRTAIAAHLQASAAYAEYQAARAAGEAAQTEMGAALSRSARLERLVRAHETRALAGRLKARGGADWQAYAALLACERWVPDVAP
jgi:hypothetical protein